MLTVLNVNTGEIITEGTWEELKEVLSNYTIVPHKRLFENYGFTDNNDSDIWVIV